MQEKRRLTTWEGDKLQTCPNQWWRTLPLHEIERLSHSVGVPAEKLKAVTRGAKRMVKYKSVDIMKRVEGEKTDRNPERSERRATTVTAKGTTELFTHAHYPVKRNSSMHHVPVPIIPSTLHLLHYRDCA
jgi:hypothetical protein